MARELVGSMTKTQAAFHRIRADIEDGRLEPGERLRAAVLREDLGMSPTPIREALRLLQAQGLVEHRPHHGMVVAEYPAEQTEEVYRLRLVLEPMATELAAERASGEQLERIRRQHAALGDAVESGDARVDAAELNAAWHRAVYEAAGSRYLEEFIARLWGVLPLEAVWRTDRSGSSVEEHERITAAIERRDATQAADLMRRHIEGTSELAAERRSRGNP
ncbi:MAG: GntR family transcriptional regulator [Rubrobacteraceae bacterium]